MVTTRSGTKVGPASGPAKKSRSKKPVSSPSESSTLLPEAALNGDEPSSRELASGVSEAKPGTAGGCEGKVGEPVECDSDQEGEPDPPTDQEGEPDPPTDQEGEPDPPSEPTVEELAMKAFTFMKKRLSKRSKRVSGLKKRSKSRADHSEECGEREEQGHEREEGVEECGEGEGHERVEGVEEMPNLLLLEAKATSSVRKARRKQSSHTKRQVELASSLQPDISEKPYFNLDREDALQGSGDSQVTWGSDADVMKRSVITPDFERKESAPPMHTSRYALKRVAKAEREKTAGKDWFDMPATPLTPELKADLRLLQMRGALDPAHHYKSLGRKKRLPKYFQVGRVISGPAEFYSSRVPRRQRKRTLVEELLADEKFQTYQRRKYRQLQAKFQSGSKRRRQIKHHRKFSK